MSAYPLQQRESQSQRTFLILKICANWQTFVEAAILRGSKDVFSTKFNFDDFIRRIFESVRPRSCPNRAFVHVCVNRVRFLFLYVEPRLSKKVGQVGFRDIVYYVHRRVAKGFWKQFLKEFSEVNLAALINRPALPEATTTGAEEFRLEI